MNVRNLKDKWHSLGAAIMDPGLSKNDLKPLWELFDHTNLEKQVAWPSTRTLARLTGIDHRNIDRHIDKIIGAGYFSLVKRGTWKGESNHYAPTYKGADAMLNRRRQKADQGSDSDSSVVTADDTPTVITGDNSPPVVTADDTLSSPVTRPVVTGDAKVSSPVTTKPTNEPAYKAGELVVGEVESGPHRDGTYGAALATAPAPGRNEEAFARFIAAYPRKSNVATAASAFDAVVASGVSTDVLVAQAAAYAARCEDENTPSKYIQEPANWLRKSRWKDDFSVKPKPPRGPRAAVAAGRNPALDTETDPATLCRLRYDELLRVLQPLPGAKLDDKLCHLLVKAYQYDQDAGTNIFRYYDEEDAKDRAGNSTKDAKRMLSAARSATGRGVWPASVRGSDEDAAMLWLWCGHEDGEFVNFLISSASELSKVNRVSTKAA